MIKHNLAEIKLLDNTTIEVVDGKFPALKEVEVAGVSRACEICPIRQVCGDNNEWDCQEYQMFSGFWDGEHLTLESALEACK